MQPSCCISSAPPVTLCIPASMCSAMLLSRCACICALERKGRALSITKRQRIHTANSGEKENKGRQRRDETQQYIPPLHPFSQLPPTSGIKAFHRRRTRLIKEKICSKQLYLNLSCLLLLRTQPLHPSHSAPAAW